MAGIPASGGMSVLLVPVAHYSLLSICSRRPCSHPLKDVAALLAAYTGINIENMTKIIAMNLTSFFM
jgi:hypothetical protein